MKSNDKSKHRKFIMNIEKQSIEKAQNYKEEILKFQKAKEKMTFFGFFDKEFIDNLNIYIAAPNEEKGLKDVLLTLDNQLVDNPKDKFNNFNHEKDVFIPSLFAFLKEFENSHIMKIWFKDVDFENLYSFDAVAVHEIAHTKSFQLISPKENYKYFSREIESNYFNQEKFINKMDGIFLEELSFQNIKNVDFFKFDFSLRDWSEIYALLYQREFLRKDNSDNEEKIEKWDNHILKASEEIGEMVINKEIPSDEFYESHSLSYLLARSLEKRFKDFSERIKYLESFKK